MLEKVIESHLRDQIKAIGGIAYKFVSPGNNGVPDRIVVMPGGRIIFVELKKPGEKPTPLQQSQHRRLRKLGCDVRVIDSKELVNDFVQEMIQK